MPDPHVVTSTPRQEKPLAPATADGLRQVLTRLGKALRFNLRLSELEFQDRHGIWRPMTVRAEAQLQEQIADAFDEQPDGDGPVGKRRRLTFSASRWRRLVNAVVRENDPFVEWLEALPSWDGEPRLDGWFRQCFQIDGSVPRSLCDWAARSVLLAAVWRAYTPGTKHDVLVVLVGPQGIGKSTSLAYLFPPTERSLWFSDEFSLGGRDKERVEALQGRVIVECAEMAGATRADVARLKAFLSRTDDGGTRLAYRRNPEPRPRRAVVVGTTNEFACLPNDPTGNRRFAPIALTAGDATNIRAWLDQHRLQLWAEARHRYRAGEAAYLPDGLVADQAGATERHRDADDVVENRIDQWLGRPEVPEYFRVEDIAHEIGLVDQRTRLSPAGGARIRAALKLRGCAPARTRLDGARHPVRCFRRP